MELVVKLDFIIRFIQRDSRACKNKQPVIRSFYCFTGIKTDPPSPFFFNLYMNDLCSELLRKSSIIDSPVFSNTNIPCLLWADDLVLLSKTKNDLQEQIDILAGYFDNWKLKVNIEKSKVIIFNKRGRLIKDENISYKESIIESVKYYKYLGLLLDSKGKFNSTINDLAKKGLRASHSTYKLSTFNVISHDLLINTFDINMIKPILLFFSEMLGYMMKENSENETVLSKFCKHILGVHRNATNCAVLSELGVYLLKIDAQVSMINFFLYLRDNKSEILAELIPEMERIDSEWLAYTKAIINE